MAARAAGILHQSFLPTPGQTRGFVWKHSPLNGGRRPRHFHIEPELNLVVSGWAAFGVGKAVLRVCAGELLGFPAGQDHVLLEASPDLYLYAIGLDPALSMEVLRDNQRSALIPLHVRLPPHDLQAMAARAARIVERTSIEQECAELWQQGHWLARRSLTTGSSAVHVLTRRALRELSESPELGLEPLAQRVRANASEISRYFHRDVGMTLLQYRSRLRLLRFIHLVEAGKDNWMTAASAAGFGSYSQCHRTFQSELGCPPREFFRSGLRHEMQQVYAS
jgi:AraC-like DNA-binding protein